MRLFDFLAITCITPFIMSILTSLPPLHGLFFFPFASVFISSQHEAFSATFQVRFKISELYFVQQ